MSELSRIIKRKDELMVWLAGSATIQDLTSARNLKLEVVEMLLPKAAKHLAKTKDVDPVTGEPRYGALQTQKIVALHQSLTELHASIEEVIREATARGLPETVVGIDASSIARKAEPPPDAIYTDKTFFDTALGYKDSARLTVEEKTTLQMQDEIKNNVLLDPLAPVKAEMRRVLQAYNGAKSGAEAFLAIVARLRDEKSPHIQSMLAFLSPLLHNICGHPDDEKLRLLRLQHPIVYEKLSRGAGSLELLCAAGFTLRCDVPPPTPTHTPSEDKNKDKKKKTEAEAEKTLGVGGMAAEPRPTEAVLGVDVDAGPLPADANTAVLFRMAHQLGLVPVAFMREPPVEDTTQWIAWFDALGEVKQACKVQALAGR
jgi:hypothetical protein